MAQDIPRRNPARPPRARATAEEWRQAKQQVLERLDIRAAYEAMGVNFLNRSESGGRLACYAIDRARERTPGSAGVTMSGEFRGYYSDFGHDRLNLSLFDFAVRFGGQPDYMAALRHFAAQAGVVLPVGGDYREKRPLRDKSPPPTKGPKRKTVCEDIGPDLLGYHRRAVEAGVIDRWAEELGLHPDSLVAQRWGLPGPGAPQEFRLDREGQTALCPECQVIDGRPVMTSADRRGGGGLKQAMPGRPRGIMPPLGWLGRARRTGYLFVCEGHTDAAALHTVGLAAIAIPSAGVGGKPVAALLAPPMRDGRLPERTAIVCLADRDGGAGRSGMAKVQHALAARLRRPIYRRELPSVECGVEGHAPAWHHPKDSREWLKLVCPQAHLVPEEARFALGLRLCEDVFVEDHGHDTNYYHFTTTVFPAPAPADSPRVTGSTGLTTEFDGRRARLVFTPTVVVEEEAGGGPPDPHKRLGVRADPEPATEPPAGPALAAVDWLDDAVPPDPLVNLPRVRPCVRNADREFWLESKAAPYLGLGLQLRCRQWSCDGCRTFLMRRWAEHLAAVFRLPPKAVWPGPEAGDMPLPGFYCRGPAAGCDRIAKYVARHKGQFVRIAQPHGRALVIATVPFPRGKRLDLDPTAEMVRAVLAIVPPRLGAVGRFVPISASTGWRPPPAPKTGEWGARGWTNVRRDSHDVFRAMGVQVEEQKPRRDPLRASLAFPAHWTDAHRAWAREWARVGIVPPGFTPGGVPPDPHPYFKLIDLVDTPPDGFDVADLDG